jgi:hypothetical protein
MIDLLGIINARDFHDSVSEDIRVMNNNKYPFIEYQKEGGKEIYTINKVDPLLARASDLDYLLRVRNWNTPERKFIDGKKNLCIIKDDGTLDYIPTIYTTENEGEYKFNENSEITYQGTILNSMAPNTTELIDDVLFGEILSIDENEDESEENQKPNDSKETGYISPINKIRKIVSNWRRIESNERKKNSITEDTLHNIISRNIEKLSGGSVDIVCFGSGIYTNIVNLNHYLEINAEKVDHSQSIIAKLGIRYTKKNQEVVDRYIKEISFFPFTFSYEYETQVRKAVSENFIREINNDVVIEYINGCIRVFPLHSDITECVISFCNLNYE